MEFLTKERLKYEEQNIFLGIQPIVEFGMHRSCGPTLLKEKHTS